MRNSIKIAAILLAGAGALISCEDDFDYKFADHGPDVTVNSISSSAYMGGEISFSVNISDKSFDLSTIKAELYFDEDVVDETTIRTKTEGTYEGTLSVPFYANIPDGTATVVFTGTNVGQGQTVLDPVGVSVTRPVFSSLTLTLEDGTEYTMEASSTKHVYEYTGSFGTDINAMITTPAVSGGPDEMTFGWDGSEIVQDGSAYIPFHQNLAGENTISFNTYSFEGSPFEVLDITIAGVQATAEDASTYYAVLDLTQDQTIDIEGFGESFADWYIDPDWLEEISDGSYKFLAIDGKYKFTIESDLEWFRVEAMADAYSTATLNSDLTGAIWLNGSSGVGKPSYDASPVNWNTGNALCLSQIEEKKYQITLVGGVSINATNVNIKFYSAKGWDGEFGSANLSCTSDLVYVNDGDSDNGNVFLNDGASLEVGGIYKFTVDLTGATASSDGAPTGAVLTVEKVGTQEIETEDISVNGTALEMVTTTSYRGNLDLTKDGQFSISGVDDLSSWYLTPDYLYTDASGNLCFNAVSGTYEVTLYTGTGYIEFVRLNADGGYAEFADGGLYLMGWGVSYPHMGNQAGWTTETAPALAQVSEGVFQFTGTARPENDTTMGGAFRTDYMSAKYFGQRGWGNEKSTINGNSNTIQYTESASAYFNQTGSDNFGFETSETEKHLEEGATYRLTIDLTQLDSNLEIIDFEKISE